MITLTVYKRSERKSSSCAEFALKNEDNGQIKKFNIEFYGYDLPNVGDTLFVGQRFWDKDPQDYVDAYRFGNVNEYYGREITSAKLLEYEVIAVKTKDKLVFQKRFYG